MYTCLYPNVKIKLEKLPRRKRQQHTSEAAHNVFIHCFHHFLQATLRTHWLINLHLEFRTENIMKQYEASIHPMFIQSFTQVAAFKAACVAQVFPGLLADFVQLCLVYGFFQSLCIACFHSLFEFSSSLHSLPPQNHGFHHNWPATVTCFLHAIYNFSR